MNEDLARLIAEQKVLKARIAELESLSGDKDAMIGKLQHQLSQALRRQFGQRAEKVDPNQLLLTIVEGLKAQAGLPVPEKPKEPPKPKEPGKKKGHGRRPVPANIERRTELHDLSDEQKKCVCGLEMKCIGDDRATQFEYVPAKLVAVEHITMKYACVCIDSTVITAAKPSSPIEKGLATSSLLAHIIMSKYLDHLPLHRQQVIMARYGIEYPRSTMWEQIRATGELVQPLYMAAVKEVLSSRILATDDTPVKVYDPTQTKARTGFVWTYVGDEQHPLIAYDYTPSRSREGPEAFLKEYSGYLQADALPGYDKLFDPGRRKLIWELACWSHVRRRFVEAMGTSLDMAVIGVSHIRVLYDIEKSAHKAGKKGSELVAWRREHSVPVLKAFETWLKQSILIVLPKSPIASAISYAISNWTALCRYVEDGDMVLDNNRSERALRGIAVGRHNWMFFGSDRGGQTAAIMLTLLKSAQRNGLNPFDYLTDVFTRIADHPQSKISELLPHNWKTARAAIIRPAA